MFDEKFSEKRLKHKVVKLILIYFNTNSAFYKNEHITYSYELTFNHLIPYPQPATGNRLRHASGPVPRTGNLTYPPVHFSVTFIFGS